MDPGRLARVLVPPLCLVCRKQADPAVPLCGDCMRALNHSRAIRLDPPEGIDRIVSCADHEGVARSLLAAYKFRGITGLSKLIGGYMADASGPVEAGGTIVPVPPAGVRAWLRGFDPVHGLAAEVGELLDTPMAPEPALVRRGAGRQRGRDRAGRLADPPRIHPAGSAARIIGGRSVLLIDDVMTTGATLVAAAAALRLAGADAVSALTFTRRL